MSASKPRWPQVWSPSVSRSAPAPSSSSARARVMPLPAAAFSAFAMTAFTSPAPNSHCATALNHARPGEPTMSPTSKTFIALLSRSCP